MADLEVPTFKLRFVGPGGEEEEVEIVGPLHVVDGVELWRLIDEGTGYEYFFAKEDGCYDGFGRAITPSDLRRDDKEP